MDHRASGPHSPGAASDRRCLRVRLPGSRRWLRRKRRCGASRRPFPQAPLTPGSRVEIALGEAVQTPKASGWRGDELQGSSCEQRGGHMSGRFQVYAGCVTGLASAIMFGWGVMAQETIITPDGRCVVSYGDRQPTVEEMKQALELGENCFRTRGLRRESTRRTTGTR